MDARRFDALARLAAAAPTRRALVKGLAGAVALGLFAARGRRAAAFNTELDFPFAVVRETDLDGQAESAYIDRPYTAYFDPSGYPEYTLTGAFPDPTQQPTTGYRQRLVIATAGGGRVVTTHWYEFDPSLGRVADAVLPGVVANYLGGRTQIAVNPAIGDGASFHAFSGQLSDGREYETVAAALALDYTLAVLRLDDYDGVTPELGEAERLVGVIAERGRQIMDPSHQHLGFGIAPPSAPDDPRLRIFNATYLAHDGTVFKTLPRDDERHAREQERLAGIVCVSHTIHTLPVGDSGDGPSAAIAANLARFTTRGAASDYLTNLPAYLEEDGPRQGFTATPRETAPDLGVNAIVWDYVLQSDLGVLPGLQIALRAGDVVAKFNARGALPLPAGSAPTAAYRAVIDDLGTAVTNDYLAERGLTDATLDAARAAVDATLRSFVDLQGRCLASAMNLCVADQVVSGGGGLTQNLAGPRWLDLAGAVIRPPDAAELFGQDPAAITANADYSFLGVEGARLAGVPDAVLNALPTDADFVLDGYFSTWSHGSPEVSDAGADPAADRIEQRVISYVFNTDAGDPSRASQLYDALRRGYFVTDNEISHDLKFGDEVALMESSGQTAAGTDYYSQFALVREQALVGLLRVDHLGSSAGPPAERDQPDDDDSGLDGNVVKDRLWIWGSYLRQEPDGPRVANADDVALLERYDRLLARVQEVDHQDLGTSFPPYSGQRFDDSHVFANSFFLTGMASDVSGGFSLAPIGQDAYTVVDGQTIRSRGRTDEQYAHALDKNREVERAFYRTEFLLTGGNDLANPDDLALVFTRSALRYTDEATAEQGFAGLDEQIAAAVALETGFDEVADPDRQTFSIAHRYFRYAAWDETGQQAGVVLALPHGETIVWFDVFSPVSLDNEHGFGEQYIQGLNGILNILAFDYANDNGLDLGLGDDDLVDQRDQFAAAMELYLDHKARHDPQRRVDLYAAEVADDGGGGGSGGVACPPGWTFDADGPLGAGCYRCSYPCLPGTTYDARLHLCVRDGQRQHCTPKYQ